MKYNYKYLVTFIGDENEDAYKAVIPAFGNTIVFGETLEELDEGVQSYIDYEIKELKKSGKPIPSPDENISASGKISLRITPVLHEKLILEASANEMSLNKYIESKLQ